MNRSSVPILVGTVAGLLTLSLACSGDGPTAVVAGPPASLLITGGQDQSIVAGKELPTILEVKIVDAQQRPVKGQVVNFRVISGGGSVFAGVAITSDSGIAKERWTLGTVAADSQRVEARAVDDKGTALVFGVFRAVALPDVPATVRKIAGDSQVVAAAATASDSLSVAVVDRYGNPVPRSTVRWTVTSGGGRVSADSSVSSDAGLAKVRWTVGQRVDSTQRVSAQHGTLTPVTFSATLKAADAAALQLSQQAAGAASGAAFGTAPKVRIRDAYGNHVTTSTAAVTLTVSAGASVVGTATSNAVNGEATFSTAGLSGTVGDYTLTYSAMGLTAATQTIAVTAGAPSQLAITTQPTGAVSGAAFTTQPVVELRDAQGNRTTSTATVTASVASGGGALQGTAAVAAVNGVATFTNLRIDRAAAHTLTFTVATPSLTATSSAFTITPGAASQLAITTPAAGARSGEAFTTQPILEVRDAAGNRVTTSTATVTASVTAGATLAGTVTANAQEGVVSFSGVAISGSVGSYTISFSASGLLTAQQPIIIPYPSNSIAAGYAHTCALTPDGVAYCWGFNNDGEIGDSTKAQRSIPTRVITNLKFADISAGLATTCALTSGGDAFCWGRGYGVAPVLIRGGIKFSSISSGMGFGCGVAGDGTGYCWSASSSPVAQLVSSSLRFVTIQTSREHRCGITATKDAYCWGSNLGGQLGDGTEIARSNPTLVSGGLSFSGIALRDEDTCGLVNDGTLYCWGRNWRGYLNVGDGLSRNAPARVDGNQRFATLTESGSFHTCAIALSGELFCWGMDCGGQLGRGIGECPGSYDDLKAKSPGAVSGNLVFKSVAGGSSHTCGVTNSGAAYCWGSSYYGALGIGGAQGADQNSAVPIPVAGGITFKTP